MIQRVGPPDGAPPRQEMPKIEPEQVDKVAKALSGGKIDVRAPYAKNEGIIKPFDTFLNENYFVNERKNFDPPVRRDESELKKMGAEWYFKVPFNEFKSRALGKPNFVTSDNVSPIDADIWWTKQAFSHDGSAHAKILKMLDKYKGDYKGAGENWEKY